MKSLELILKQLENIIAENKKQGIDPARQPGGYLYQAYHRSGYMSDYMREYRKNHRQELTEYMAQYRKDHPEETKERDRKYVAAYRKRAKMLSEARKQG